MRCTTWTVQCFFRHVEGRIRYPLATWLLFPKCAYITTLPLLSTKYCNFGIPSLQVNWNTSFHWTYFPTLAFSIYSFFPFWSSLKQKSEKIWVNYGFCVPIFILQLGNNFCSYNFKWISFLLKTLGFTRDVLINWFFVGLIQAIDDAALPLVRIPFIVFILWLLVTAIMYCYICFEYIALLLYMLC